MRTVTRTHAHALIFFRSYTFPLLSTRAWSLTMQRRRRRIHWLVCHHLIESTMTRSLNRGFCQRRRRLLFVYFVAMRKSCRMLSGLSSLSVSGTFEIKPRAPSLLGLWNVDGRAVPSPIHQICTCWDTHKSKKLSFGDKKIFFSNFQCSFLHIIFIIDTNWLSFNKFYI